MLLAINSYLIEIGDWITGSLIKFLEAFRELISKSRLN